MTDLDHRQQTVPTVVKADGTARVPRRLAGVAGLVFFALYFVSSAILAGMFGQTESLAVVQRTFAEQADGADVACALVLIGTPLLLLVATALRDALGASDRGVAALVVPGAVGFAALTLANAALMGGTAFLAESSTVDGSTAAFAHSAGEALLFYADVLLGTVALAVAAASAGRLPRWYRIAATVLGVGMVVGSAASPLLRDLAFMAGMSTYAFLIATSVVLLRRPSTTA